MERRLYPDLDPFYKFSNIEYGGHAQFEECAPDYPNLDADEIHDIPIPDTTADDNDDDFQLVSEETLLRRMPRPITPTAPPLTDMGGSLLESLYSYIMEELEPPPYSPNDPLSDNDTWTDDLQPDYDNDISADDVIVPETNFSPRVVGGDHTNNNDNNVSGLAENNRGNHRVGGNNNSNNNNVTPRHSCGSVANHVRSINRDSRGAKNNNNNNNNHSSNNNSNDMIIVTNRNLEAGDQHTDGRRSKINSEYGAWVTWRKNVNRQLATVILLRRGGHVHLQNTDLSRRPLSKTSMDYVIRSARKCNGGSGNGRAGGSNAQGTSLNGTPYIMYGIPRVALSKHPPKRD